MHALVVLLALPAGEPVSWDRFADVLWPKTDQRAAPGTLPITHLALDRLLVPFDPGLLVMTDEAVSLNVQRAMIGICLYETLTTRADAEPRIEALTSCRGFMASPSAPSEPFTDLLQTGRERFTAYRPQTLA